jgi:pimeloyl-ACP methyl ester carboxylesterase
VGPADQGLPTVIAESGLGGDSSHFGPLVPLLASAPFRSCAYDRAGMGQSDPPPDGSDGAPGPVTLQDGVEDLHALLAAADVPPPYVLLGWSIGGWYSQAFAERYPSEVAGIVLVDATHPDEAARLAAVIPPHRSGEDPAIGLARVLLAGIENDPPSPPIGWLDLARSGDEARALGDLGDLPLVVLSQGRADLDLGLPGLVLPEPYGSRLKTAAQALQAELASLSTRGEQRTVTGAGHAIQLDDPAAVAQAIMDVQAAIAEAE